MRSLIFIISISVANALFGQITFEPTFINQCSNEVLRFQYWTLTDSVKTYGIQDLNLKNNSLSLPRLGNYQLRAGFNDLVIDLKISNNGINRDTFFLKKITQRTPISNPSVSNYFDCDTLAHGKITDYYFNGKPRLKGTFEKGRVIDTLFSYLRTGQLNEVFIPKRKKIVYFENGNLKSEETWGKKNKSTLIEYFPNGDLKRKQNHKKLEIYNQDKVVVEKIKRKEILIFERLFAKKKYGREKFYEYKWESFDDRGIIKRKIIFDADYFKTSPFPNSVQQIDGFLFEQIIFYFNGQEFKKIALELADRNTLSRKLVLYQKEGKNWVREKTTTINKIHEMIENYSN